MRHIVIAFRMPTAGMTPGPEGPYLARARSLCARGEALGGRLIAWSAALLAMAWDTDSIEEAILLAASIHEESLAPERAWACGIAEGELEELAPDGARMHLAWGEALLAAASLARIARPREALVDGEVRALRAGQLALLGARAATDAGQRVRGWRLDLEHPWKRAADAAVEGADATDRYFVFLPDEVEAPEPSPEPEPVSEAAPASPGATQQTAVVDAEAQVELSTSDVLEMIEASVEVEEEAEPAPPESRQRRGSSPLAERVRRLARGDRSADAIEALAELRRVRTRAEGGPPTSRCQAALALAMTLAIAGRPEEALLEALDALARAKETQDPRALDACTALLVKLYAGAGRPEEAAILRESR